MLVGDHLSQEHDETIILASPLFAPSEAVDCTVAGGFPDTGRAIGMLWPTTDVVPNRPTLGIGIGLAAAATRR